MRAANLNAGVLPSGARFLVSNASPKPKAVAGQVTAGHSHASSRRRAPPPPHHEKHHEKNPGRDPLTLAVSEDGLTFSKAWALLSCHELAGPGQKDGCVNRYEGKVRNFARTLCGSHISFVACTRRNVCHMVPCTGEKSSAVVPTRPRGDRKWHRRLVCRGNEQ